MGQNMGRNAAHNETRRKEIKSNYYIDGNTVRRLEGEPEERRQRQLEEERELQKQKHRHIAKRNQEKAQRLNFGYVLFCTMALTVLCAACFFYIKVQSDITVRVKRISKLEAGIEGLRAENDAAVRQMQLMTDLNAIKEKALEYGMKYAGKEQIFYYSIEAEDYMEQYSDIPEK